MPAEIAIDFAPRVQRMAAAEHIRANVHRSPSFGLRPPAPSEYLGEGANQFANENVGENRDGNREHEKLEDGHADRTRAHARRYFRESAGVG